MKINGEMHYLWRAVDQEGEVLESYVTKTRDKAAALRFMKKALKRHGSPEAVTTDGLRIPQQRASSSAPHWICFAKPAGRSRAAWSRRASAKPVVSIWMTRLSDPFAAARAAVSGICASGG